MRGPRPGRPAGSRSTTAGDALPERGRARGSAAKPTRNGPPASAIRHGGREAAGRPAGELAGRAEAIERDMGARPMRILHAAKPMPAPTASLAHLPVVRTAHARLRDHTGG